VFSFTSRPLYPRYPVDMRLGGSQSLSGRGGEEKKSHYCPRLELNHCRRASSPVPTPTELYRLLENKGLISLNYSLQNFSSRDSSVVWLCATGWTIGILGFDSRRGLGIILFTTASRTALGPPIQWVGAVLSLGVKRPGV
jgi:hypothetical protein